MFMNFVSLLRKPNVVCNVKKNPMKILISILITFLCFSELFATPQYPDKILYNDIEYSLETNPLEQYFNKNQDTRPKGGVESTGLWRGYVATFEIIENQLYVKDVQIQIYNEKDKSFEWISVIDEIFPGLSERKIDWYNGILTLPYGELITYVHEGYSSTFENYILIEIADGKSIKSKNINYKEYETFKGKQFEIFKKSKRYIERKKELEKNGWKEKDIDLHLRSNVYDYTEIIIE